MGIDLHPFSVEFPVETPRSLHVISINLRANPWRSMEIHGVSIETHGDLWRLIGDPLRRSMEKIHRDKLKSHVIRYSNTTMTSLWDVAMIEDVSICG